MNTPKNQNYIIDTALLYKAINEAIINGILPTDLFALVKLKETTERKHRKIVDTAIMFNAAANMLITQRIFIKHLPPSFALVISNDIATLFSGYNEGALENAHVFVTLLIEQLTKGGQMIKNIIE